MNKNAQRTITILAVLLVVFSVLTFAIPFEKNAVLVIAYLFGVIAIAFQLYVLKLSFDHGANAKSKFYGFPIARIGIYYLVGQIVVSFIEMACSSFLPTWVAVVINIVALAVVLVGCISAEMMRDEVERQDVKIKQNVSNMRTLQSLSASVIEICEDADAKTKLQNLAEEIKYSDTVTCEASEVLEQGLIRQMKDIQTAVIEKNYLRVSVIADKALIDLKERNRVCSVNK